MLLFRITGWTNIVANPVFNEEAIGEEAAGILLKGIKGSREVIMPRTGHMFRFSHPSAYSLEI